MLATLSKWGTTHDIMAFSLGKNCSWTLLPGLTWLQTPIHTELAYISCVRNYRTPILLLLNVLMTYGFIKALWCLSTTRRATMVSEMVQNSQSLYSFTFSALIDVHEYIYSHSTTEFTFKKYIYSHLPVYFLFTIIFVHIYEMSSFTFNHR